MAKSLTSKIIEVKDVRLAFVNLYQNEIYNGSDTGKKSATLLIPKERKILTEIDDEIKKLIAEAGLEGDLKRGKVRLPVKDGDNETYDGYAGNMTIKATNGKRFPIIDRKRQPVFEKDELFYSGVRANVMIQFWVQDNSFGKAINTNLMGVQFVAHDEEFSGSVDTTNMFEELSEDDWG